MTSLAQLIGTRRDWRLTTPRVHPPRPHLGWVGPLVVMASVLVSWPAFSGAQGEGGRVALGLYVGAVSILLMAWSFVLAVRIRVIEPLFGGLDSMYRVHRWAGSLAVVFMFLHTRLEPEVDNGVRGAGKAIADRAEDLAGVAELMLYGLVGLSLLRLVPYRYWRLTHKLLGVPFLFASLHFFTAEKTYANNSPWGWWFGGFMAAGLVAYGWRILVRDVLFRGHRYRVAAVDRRGSTTTLDLEPIGRPLRHRAGQFAFVKIQRLDLSEPHAFTIASSPDRSDLRFVVRDLGDWTSAVRTADDLVGTPVIVEGPYGTFRPFGEGGGGQPVVWVAGGVGITPFLSAIDSLDARSGPAPHLFYAVRSRGDNPVVDRLTAARDEGRIVLHVYASDEGERLGGDDLLSVFGTGGLGGAHVGLCGPAGLVADMDATVRRLGATSVEREDFDIRQGIGPERSREIDRLLRRAVEWLRRRAGLPTGVGGRRPRVPG